MRNETSAESRIDVRYLSQFKAVDGHRMILRKRANDWWNCGKFWKKFLEFWDNIQKKDKFFQKKDQKTSRFLSTFLPFSRITFRLFCFLNIITMLRKWRRENGEKKSWKMSRVLAPASSNSSKSLLMSWPQKKGNHGANKKKQPGELIKKALFFTAAFNVINNRRNKEIVTLLFSGW